jgi:hypothetical protein
MVYEITATVNGIDNVLIISTKFFNEALEAKKWSLEQKHTNVTFLKF